MTFGGHELKQGSNTLLRAGLGASVLYLGAMAVYAWRQWPALLKMEPYEFADFLAGSFAPLGVLGLLLTIIQAHKALASARDANATARAVGQAQVRCYLSPHDVTFSMETTGSPTLKMTMENSGQSPAYDVRFAFHVRLHNTTNNWFWECQGSLAAAGSGRIIAAGSEGEFSLTLANGQQMPQGQLSDFLLAPHLIAKVEAVSSWQDVFGHTFRETWRFQSYQAANLLETAAPLWPDSPSITRHLV